MKINKKELEIWLTHLYAGTYKKGREALEIRKNYCCCLGVGCKVLIPNENLKLENDKLAGYYPQMQSSSPDWLKEIDKDFKIKSGVHLSNLNDQTNKEIIETRNMQIKGNFSHPEIADLLQLVYIHKMLD